MKKEEEAQYQEEYAEAKRKGIPFFPDAVFKDAIVALIVFVFLVGLSVFEGASLEEVADPSDSSYTPRPEWYFLFLFQLLKYFPGDLEVLGVFVIPMIAIGFLVALPWVDRSARRHWSGRPVVSSITVLLLVGAVFLTVQAFLEEAPPAAAVEGGDQTALLYAQNCAGCHGSTVAVRPGVDLFQVIQGGVHDDMPAWNSDLAANEIDALIGFILAPNGYEVYLNNCRLCHDVDSLAEADTTQLRRAIDEGADFPPHAGLALPPWRDTLSADEQARLLNFLAAPDGQRLWTQECSSCHGVSVAYSGERAELEAVIRQGGGHLEMPAFTGQLSPVDIETLAVYVTDPAQEPEGPALFSQYCVACHATRVPLAPDIGTARTIIVRGGAHEDMPVWGEIFTDEQIDALVSYVIAAAQLPDLGEAEQLYLQNCASCHGDLGEGGINPSRPGDVIAPISTAEYLGTRDDTTLRAIISQGQPNFGMSPFGDSFGGPLTTEQVDLIVSFMRAWQANPPVELPPDTPSSPTATQDSEDVYLALCAQCHGDSGEGGVGTVFDVPWQDSRSDQDIFDDINLGHQATAMIAWGEILTSQQIEDLVDHIRTLTGEPRASGPLTYEATIRPIFEDYCLGCHGTLGGWTGTTYQEAMTTGTNGPTIIPGDPDNSRLVQSMVGTHPEGVVMPPSVTMSAADIQKIIDWVAAGAPER
ncbi:MAG: c-type cytochrome [Acidimicrobiia bacterium]|nr:c-type cytochrome [Acidimicrobiia bacterium]